MQLDFSNDQVVREILASPEIAFMGNRLVVYLQPVLELQLKEHNSDVKSYFDLLIFITWLKCGCFFLLFGLLSVFIFWSLVKRLTNEIWLNRGMLNIIPRFILEQNVMIQSYVFKQKTVI